MWQAFLKRQVFVEYYSARSQGFRVEKPPMFLSIRQRATYEYTHIHNKHRRRSDILRKDRGRLGRSGVFSSVRRRLLTRHSAGHASVFADVITANIAIQIS